MTKGRKRGPLGGKLVRHCDECAKEMARELMNDDTFAGKLTKEDEDFIAFCLSDELMHFFHGTLRFLYSDPDGEKFMKTLAATRAGRESARARRSRSVKERFLDWALRENSKNPQLSKNAVAEKYARENPGVSVTTLRRYLSDIPNA